MSLSRISGYDACAAVTGSLTYALGLPLTTLPEERSEAAVPGGDYVSV